MKRVNRILIIILALLSIFMIIFAITLYIRNVHSSGESIEMGTIEADIGFISENPALYQNTMAIEDWNLDNYPYRVYIINPADLASLGMDSFAIDSLEPFLDLYINMYDTSGEKYQGEIMSESFISNESIPQFTVSIHQANGEELMVKCSYWVQAQLYEFSCSLSE